MANYLGAQPRHTDSDLQSLVEEVRAAVELVAFEHASRQQILDTFVEIYREMEGDERTDGACHLLAAHAHIVLAEHGIENVLRVGEVGWRSGEIRGTGSHSWIDIGGLCFDVAMGRPLELNKLYDQLPVLGTIEIPTGRTTGVRYDVPGALDEGGQKAAESTIAEYMSGLRAASGIDFWFWVERTCRRMGLRTVRSGKLAKTYRDARWTYSEPKSVWSADL